MTAAVLAARFEELVDGLGTDTAAAVLKAYTAWQSGLIDTDTFTAAVAQLLTVANVNARATGDVFATATVNDRFGEHRVPLGSLESADADLARLGKAAATIAAALDGDTDVAMRLERISRDEPARAAQQEVLDSYARHGVTGYRRHTDADPCELCVWLVKAHLDPEGIGFIYPTSAPFHRHTGCRCTPVPATRKAKR